MGTLRLFEGEPILIVVSNFLQQEFSMAKQQDVTNCQRSHLTSDQGLMCFTLGD